MGIWFMDGFDEYSSTADMLRTWVLNGWGFNATAGRNGGGAMYTAVGGQSRTPIGGMVTPNGTSIGCNFWMKFSAVPNAQSPTINYRTGGETAAGAIGFNTSGQIILISAGQSQVAAGSSFNFCDNNWHYVETRWNGGGSVNQICYVDGLQQWNGGFG